MASLLSVDASKLIMTVRKIAHTFSSVLISRKTTAGVVLVLSCGINKATRLISGASTGR